MRRRHLEAWAPHCPACAPTRATPAPLLLNEPTLLTAEGDVLSGTLLCSDPACRHEYPVIDGIPIITPGLRKLLGDRAIDLLLRDDLDPATLSLIGDALGPDSWFDIHRQGISTYAWDSWADLDPAEPSPGPNGPHPGAARACLAALLDLAAPTASATRILDLGCAAARTSFDLAEHAPGALVLGIDTNLALLRLAGRASRAEPFAYGRRRIGLVYDRRTIHPQLPGSDRVDIWACDATALPFPPATAQLVLALNLLDCVPNPAALLTALATILQPGGTLLLATPFDWAARATPAENWIGGHSQRGPGGGAAEPLLHALLDAAHQAAPPGLTLRATANHPWQTRLHDRARVTYETYLAVAGKH